MDVEFKRLYGRWENPKARSVYYLEMYYAVSYTFIENRTQK